MYYLLKSVNKLRVLSEPHFWARFQTKTKNTSLNLKIFFETRIKNKTYINLMNHYQCYWQIYIQATQKSCTIFIFIFIFDLIIREKLTVQERVEFVFMFGRTGATHRSVAREFNLNHPERERPLRIARATDCQMTTITRMQ